MILVTRFDVAESTSKEQPRVKEGFLPKGILSEITIRLITGVWSDLCLAVFSESECLVRSGDLIPTVERSGLGGLVIEHNLPEERNPIRIVGYNRGSTEALRVRVEFTLNVGEENEGRFWDYQTLLSIQG